MWIALLILLAVGLRVFAGLPPRPAGLVRLSRRDAAFVQAAAETMFPAGGDPAPSAADAEVLAYVERYLGWHGPPLRLLMRLLFALFEHATLFLVPTWRRFSQLDDTARAAYLRGWERSSLYPRRLLFQSLRAIMCLAYVAHPAVEAALGCARPAACATKAVTG